MLHLSLASDKDVIEVTWARMVVMFASPRVIVLLQLLAMPWALQPKIMLLQPLVLVQPAQRPAKKLSVPVVLLSPA